MKVRIFLLLVVFFTGTATAANRLPADVMSQLVKPWPPQGWSEVLNLPSGEQSEPYQSEAQVRVGYFGQSLYRHISGTDSYWTANVLIQDRGSRGAAWRAVSTVRCKSTNYRGYRARECRRGAPGYITKTLHYEIDRFYITIQMSGPGEADYPLFDLR